jgi:hypothetical protein
MAIFIALGLTTLAIMAWMAIRDIRAYHAKIAVEAYLKTDVGRKAYKEMLS